MNMKKFNYKEFQEFIKTPKGKAVLFFGVYLFFFLFIAVMARSGGSTLDRKYDSGSKYQFSIASIQNKNFNFSYEVVVDGNITTYNGSSAQSTASFTKNGVNTYYYNGNYFTNNNGVWLNVENPFIEYNFIDTSKIQSILDKAMYISKTEFDTGGEVYNFKIASATLSKLFDNKDLDVEEVPNEIEVSVNEENIVDGFTYKLDSYCKAKNSCLSGMKITLKYTDFGKVEKITSPLE